MDAGLAAVLGATVGALGTAMTGATAAFLSRSTARHQVRTDTLRTLRDARRATYAGYAKAIDHYLDKLGTTLILLERVERLPEQREEWVESAHRRWIEALRYRQTEVDTQRILLQLDATPQVSETALQVAKWCVLLSRSTGRAIADLKGRDLDTGPLSPPSPGYAQLLVAEGFDPEKPDLDRLLSRARDAYGAFLSMAAADLGEYGVLT
ncbi:hypothetical protein [Streptomyces sp. ITFR-16]|uniref:hypothetical protein n=1 Tax=Streptomyces sp. ITFR-16 TaxID=3075198 RepID=UPI00288AFFAD|nr:hypothetical protein [Streptomyces sp. ITFR-16]WNI27300.1 hypothetical protein RLT58_35780 [Streptomyces sp. ITFR-16]